MLMGFGGALAAPEVALSLLREGFEVVAFRLRGTHVPVSRLRGVTIVDVTSPWQDTSGAVADLHSIVRASDPEAILPLDDAAVWLCAQVAPGHEAKVVGPLGERVALALDKRVQLRAAAAAGLAVPESLVCAAAATLEMDRFPVILKPALAVRESQGKLERGSAQVCGDLEELRVVVESLDPETPVIVQPWIRGVGEGLSGIARDGTALAWSAHRRVRMFDPAGSGSSACASTTVDPRVREGAEPFLSDADWQGLFMLEFLRDREGTAWFVELNGRAWGSMALTRRMGFELPAWAVRTTLEPDWRPALPKAVPPVMCRHLGGELLHLMQAFRKPPSKALVEEWPPRRRALRDIVRVGRRDRWYNLHRGTSALFLDEALTTVGRVVSARLR